MPAKKPCRISERLNVLSDEHLASDCAVCDRMDRSGERRQLILQRRRASRTVKGRASA